MTDVVATRQHCLSLAKSILRPTVVIVMDMEGSQIQQGMGMDREYAFSLVIYIDD